MATRTVKQGQSFTRFRRNKDAKKAAKEDRKARVQLDIYKRKRLTKKKIKPEDQAPAVILRKKTPTS